MCFTLKYHIASSVCNAFAGLPSERLLCQLGAGLVLARRAKPSLLLRWQPFVVCLVKTLALAEWTQISMHGENEVPASTVQSKRMPCTYPSSPFI